MAVWSSSLGIPCCGFPPSLPLSPSPHSQQLFLLWPCSPIPNLQFPAPCTPLNIHPSLGHIVPWYGPSVYFSLCQVCYQSTSSPSSDSLKCFPLVPVDFPTSERVSLNSGIFPLFQLPHPGVQAPSCFLSSSSSLLFFILASYAGIFIVISGVQGLLLVFSQCSVRIVASIIVFLMYLWRDMNSMSSYFSSIFNPENNLYNIFKNFLF